jgi:xanthine dehydrogenase YagS FAD-binding subunit
VKAFEYAVPASLEEAAALLAGKKGRARLLAGGTDLVTQLQGRVAEPERVVSLGGLPHLDRIEPSAKALKIGPLASLTGIASHPEVRKVWTALAEGAGAAATPQIRNAGTLGGNLCQRPRCWYFRNEDFPCRKKGGEICYAIDGENKYHAIFGGDACRIVHPSDTAPALVAFGASLVAVSSTGARDVPAAEFFTMPETDVRRENVLAEDEILASVSVPRPAAGSRSGYLKIREKASFDFALVSCAAVLTFSGTACTAARIVLGGVAPVPWRCPGAEEILAGAPLDAMRIHRAAEAALSGASPLAKNRYKIAMAQAAVRRLLGRLIPS